MRIPTYYKRYRLVVSYNGTQYFGWQRQKNQIKTVQQVLEMNYGRMYGEDEGIIGSSRTDRGVHSHYNTCDVALNDKKNISKFVDYINRKKEDIFIKAYTHVDYEWNSRKAAKERTYIYRIVITKKREPKELKDHVWFQNKVLNIDSMVEAAKILEGKHDFSAFMSKTPSNKNVKRIRKIRECKVTQRDFVKSDLDFPKLNVDSSSQ
jgi:tRNA pseudouridine38-40 synthase